MNLKTLKTKTLSSWMLTIILFVGHSSLTVATQVGAVPGSATGGVTSNSNPYNPDILPWVDPKTGISKHSKEDGYQDCGQECIYRQANSNLILRGRYLQHRLMIEETGNGESGAAKDSVLSDSEKMMMKINLQGVREGVVKNNAAILELEGHDEKGARVGKATMNAEGLDPTKKPVLPTVETSDELAADIARRAGTDRGFMQSVERPDFSVKQTAEYKKRLESVSKGSVDCSDLILFKEVARDPSNAGGDKIVVPILDGAGKPQIDAAACTSRKQQVDAKFTAKWSSNDEAAIQKKMDDQKNVYAEAKKKWKPGGLKKAPHLKTELGLTQDQIDAFHQARNDVAVAAKKEIEGDSGLQKGTAPKKDVVNSDITEIPLVTSGGAKGSTRVEVQDPLLLKQASQGSHEFDKDFSEFLDTKRTNAATDQVVLANPNPYVKTDPNTTRKPSTISDNAADKQTVSSKNSSH